MSATTHAPGPSRVMAWHFPELIDTRSPVLGLPADTVVSALGRRWLADGAGNFWPGGRGNSKFVRDLLAGGPIRVELLPVIAAGEELQVLTDHLLNAILARRGELSGADYEFLYPAATAFDRRANDATVRHIISTAHARKLTGWLEAHLGELGVDAEESLALVL